MVIYQRRVDLGIYEEVEVEMDKQSASPDKWLTAISRSTGQRENEIAW